MSRINFKEIDYKSIIIPPLITGLIAGLSEFIAKEELGWQTALISSGIAFLITVGQELNRQFNPPRITETGTKKTNLLVNL